MQIQIPTDIEWQKNRQQRWDSVWENSLRVIGISKQEKKEEDEAVAALKIWYLTGDLSPVLALPDNEYKHDAIDINAVMQLCPATDIEVYKRFFVDYSMIVSELDSSYWGRYEEGRNVSFYKSFFTLYSGEHIDSTAEIYTHMLRMFLPNEQGIVTFPLLLGNDKWQPTQEIAPCDVANIIFEGIGKYLFAAEGEYQYYSHLSNALPYVKALKSLNPQIFDTKLLTNKPKRPAPPPTPLRIVGASQKLIRAAIGNLLGYKSGYEKYSGPLRHNNLVLEQQLRELIEDVDMPEEFHHLVSFIHNNPDDFVTRSE